MLLSLLATAGPALAAPAFLDQGFILVAPATGNFAAGIGAPSVDYDVATGTWAMYFEAPVPTVPAECTTAYSIGRATSADGINWTIDAEPVLGPDLGTPGSPFHCVASQPAVVYDGATWHLFFTMASEPIGVGQPDTSTGIGYATSTDGVHFTVQAAPLIPYDGVSMGLASAAIVDRVLTLIYVWRPDFRLATLPLDGATNWTLDADPVLRSESAGAWALQWVLGPSLYCEDDQTDPFSLVFGGDDNANVRNLGYAQSPDARHWALDDANPLVGGDLDANTLNHWDVLEAGPDTLMWYSKTDPASGLKAIGYAVTALEHDPVGPRMCPHPGPPDTQPTDSGTGDSSAPDSTAPGETGTGGKEPGPCGCVSGDPGGAAAAAAGVSGALLAARRRRSRITPGSCTPTSSS